jgi:hypothetical protein
MNVCTDVVISVGSIGDNLLSHLLCSQKLVTYTVAAVRDHMKQKKTAPNTTVGYPSRFVFIQHRCCNDCSHDLPGLHLMASCFQARALIEGYGQQLMGHSLASREQKSKRQIRPKASRYGETGNRTQNLLHSTGTMKYDAKKMSYH